MNPFLSKPLRKIQPIGGPKNSSQEHRPSRYINPNLAKKINQDKKAVDLQKLKNPSPKDKNIKNNNLNLINPNKIEDDKKITNTNIKFDKPNENEHKINNNEQINKIDINEVKKEKIENNIKIFKSNLKIDNNIKINLYRPKSDKLVFNNNDEILDYVKSQIREGNIKNIIQKLDLKKNDFTGFTLSKKKQGYTIYELELEEDIDKINETFKKQKVEINKKPVELVISNQNETSSKKENIKKEYEIKDKDKDKDNKDNKDNKDKDKKNIFESKKTENLIHAMKNKTMEREMGNIKKEKINNDLKILQNKVHKQKEELRNAENENDYIRKEVEKKANMRASNKVNFKLENDIISKRRESGLKIKTKEENEPVNPIPNTNETEKKRTIEENQRRATRAMARFKKAYSSHKGKEENKGPQNSDKIQTLAAILQEHIIKPMAEIQEENDGKMRGGSVDSRPIKYDGMAELLENAPAQKKNVKKPKNVNFGQ